MVSPKQFLSQSTGKIWDPPTPTVASTPSTKRSSSWTTRWTARLSLRSTSRTRVVLKSRLDMWPSKETKWVVGSRDHQYTPRNTSWIIWVPLLSCLRASQTKCRVKPTCNYKMQHLSRSLWAHSQIFLWILLLSWSHQIHKCLREVLIWIWVQILIVMDSLKPSKWQVCRIRWHLNRISQLFRLDQPPTLIHRQSNRMFNLFKIWRVNKIQHLRALRWHRSKFHPPLQIHYCQTTRIQTQETNCLRLTYLSKTKVKFKTRFQSLLNRMVIWFQASSSWLAWSHLPNRIRTSDKIHQLACSTLKSYPQGISLPML